ELGSLFSIDVGSVPDPEEVLAKADRQLIELSKNQKIDGFAAKQFSELLADDDGTDPFTGILARDGFNVAVRHAFGPAHSGEYPLSVAQVVIHGYDELGSSVGETAQDEVIIGTSVLLRRHFEHLGGVVCRLADSIFAVVMPGVERSVAAKEASQCCMDFSRRAPGWISEEGDGGGSVRLSVGIAALDDSTRAMMSGPETLVKAASQAVLAARAGEGSAVRSFVPRKNAA
ncbi:MAG: GGDEF domain-containing protein, partial [Phycisphaerales bacterium]